VLIELIFSWLSVISGRFLRSAFYAIITLIDFRLSVERGDEMDTSQLIKTPKPTKVDTAAASKSKQSEEKSNLKSIITSSKAINDKLNSSKRNQTSNSTSKRTRG